MKFCFTALFVGLLFCAGLRAETLTVKDQDALNRALRKLEDGDVLKIAPGKYRGGNVVKGVENLRVEALDPEKPPLFSGGNEGWHFSRTPGLVLQNLAVRDMKHNGINIDDGGELDQPVEDVTLENISVENTGPDGNFDAIKCSGLKKLRIKNCRISGWGGQAIDFVGCREALITGCVITGKKGYSQHTGPQFKGGCENIVMEKCQLTDAGPRPIQIGGSTGKAFFRPAGATYEARKITVRDNVIEGGQCATAFTGCTEVLFTKNKIVEPEKWIFRILQETKRKGFLPCGEVTVSENVIVFRRKKIGGTEINIGPGTAAETFRFARNHWFAKDKPAQSKPRKLPVAETAGVYGKVPGK